ERSEEILYNAAKAYQAARLIMKSIAARQILINPKYGLNNTELAKRSVYEIGGNYQAIAVYDQAADWYEKFAKDYPKMEKAPQAPQDAVVLRLGLGQEELAIKDADLFNRNYGGKSAAETAKIAFAIGAHYVDKEDWYNARKRLTTAMGQIDRNATFDVQIQAHALLGRVFARANQPTQAAPEYNKVRNSWKDPQGGIKKVDAVGGDQDERVRRLAKVLTAVGEAQFFFAEQKRKDADKIQFPAYHGSGQREEVLKHVKTKVVDWMKKKQTA